MCEEQVGAMLCSHQAAYLEHTNDDGSDDSPRLELSEAGGQVSREQRPVTVLQLDENMRRRGVHSVCSCNIRVDSDTIQGSIRCRLHLVELLCLDLSVPHHNAMQNDVIDTSRQTGASAL